MSAEYQPRWLAYCRATRAAPDADGHGYRFIIWCQARWAEWDGVAGQRRLAKSPTEHAAFDAWLQAATVPTDAQGQTELALETA